VLNHDNSDGFSDSPQDVIATASVVVASPCRASPRIVSGKIEAMTLMAPPPVRLPGEISAILNQIVISAARIVMGSASGTVRTGVSGEVHALAFMAPPPVALTVRHLHILRNSIISATRIVVGSACGTDDRFVKA
jgi:hypothetical protein